MVSTPRSRLVVALLLAVIAVSCADAPTRPSAVTQTPGAPPAPLSPFMVQGTVVLGHGVSLAGARLEAVSGERAGTACLTNSFGFCSLEGVFTEPVNVRVTADRFASQVVTVRGGSAQNHLTFTLRSLAEPPQIQGSYSLTIEASRNCAARLPEEFRRVTVPAQILQDRDWLLLDVGSWSVDTIFGGVLIGEDLLLQLLSMHDWVKVTPRMYVIGAAEGRVQGATLSLLFDGGIEVLVGPSEIANCSARDHRLTFVR